MAKKRKSKKRKSKKIHIGDNGSIPKTPNPVIPESKITSRSNWTFSFEFFKQIKYFGLSEVDPKWFVALLERLSDLSKMEIESFRKSTEKMTSVRYHPIKWTQPNIPIKRADLTWLPSEILDNSDDFPMLQFQISTGNGRIVGFWGVDSRVFYIVLLDPLHNIQPSKRYSYKVDDCEPLNSEYMSLLADINNCKAKKTDNCNDCRVFKALEGVPSSINITNFFATYIDDDMKKRLEGKSHQEIVDIFELGLIAAEEDDKRSN